MTVLEEVAAERRRQVEQEGWTSAHDDVHTEHQLARAAACYAMSATGNPPSTFGLWPWDVSWWKPKGPRRDLIRAAALLVAEIERIDRRIARTGAAERTVALQLYGVIIPDVPEVVARRVVAVVGTHHAGLKE